MMPRSNLARRTSTRVGTMLAVVAASLGLLAIGSPAAHAQAAGVQVTTPFPSVTVEAGETTTLDLRVTASSPQTVDLSIQAAPEGWTTTLRGGGFVISSISAGTGDEPAEASLEVQVPADATGATTLEVVAEGEEGDSDTLPVTLRVQESVQGAISLEAEFPELRGSADDTFTYSLALRNATPNDVDFTLSATGPEGWQVTARPSTETRATTVTVPGGGEQTIDVEAVPPDGVTAGNYEIQVSASGAGQDVAATLVAQVTGTTEFELTTPNEQLNASGTTGNVTRIPLVIRNTGSAPLTAVALSASPPTDWEVTFEPETAQIPPGEQAQVTALVTPANQAVTGDYIVTLTAEQEGTSQSVDIRYTVETSAVWGVVGVLVILAILGGLAWVFRRYGRR